MSARKIQLLLILVTLGIGSALLIMNASSSRTGGAASQPMERANSGYEVLKMSKGITRGSLVALEDFKIFSVKSRPSPGAIMQSADAVGRVALRDIAPGEILSTANTSDNGRAEGLARLIPSGFRAVALGVSDEIAVGNLIRAGDRVDVLVVSKRDSTSADRRSHVDTEARLLLQGVQVLAVGPAVVGSTPKESAYRNVTLSVTPRQSAVLALARAVGTYYLALRAADDRSVTAPISVSTEDLRLAGANHNDTIGAEQTAGAERVIEVISGSSRTSEVVPRNTGD